MPTIQETKEKLIHSIIQCVKAGEIWRKDTCNCSSYGWVPAEHFAMEEIQRSGIRGVRISHAYRHEVHEWTAVLDGSAEPVVVSIHVRGGVAYAPNDCDLPPGVCVQIIDHDNEPKEQGAERLSLLG